METKEIIHIAGQYQSNKFRLERTYKPKDTLPTTFNWMQKVIRIMINTARVQLELQIVLYLSVMFQSHLGCWANSRLLTHDRGYMY